MATIAGAGLAVIVFLFVFAALLVLLLVKFIGCAVAPFLGNIIAGGMLYFSSMPFTSSPWTGASSTPSWSPSSACPARSFSPCSPSSELNAINNRILSECD